MRIGDHIANYTGMGNAVTRYFLRLISARSAGVRGFTSD